MLAGHLDAPPGGNIVPPPLPAARAFFFMCPLGSIMCPLGSIVCLPACFNGQSRTQDTLKVACYLPEGFDGDEGRLLLYGMLARQRVSRFAPPSLTTPTARSTTYQVLLQRCRSENIPAVGACPFGSSTTFLAGLATLPMSFRPHRTKVIALTMLVVTTTTPIYIYQHLRRLLPLLPQTPRGSASAPIAMQGRAVLAP